MDTGKVLDMIRRTGSPLKRQLLLVSLITGMLRERGKDAPVVVGGCALSYYSREVYFTADIDLAYSDREALDAVLKALEFVKEGRYWVNDELKTLVEAPASSLAGQDSPVEVVQLPDGLECRVIGIEDLIIDRLNACKQWKSEIDCEMVELLVKKYSPELDWPYLEKRAKAPENDAVEELAALRKKAGR